MSRERARDAAVSRDVDRQIRVGRRRCRLDTAAGHRGLCRGTRRPCSGRPCRAASVARPFHSNSESKMLPVLPPLLVPLSRTAPIAKQPFEDGPWVGPPSVMVLSRFCQDNVDMYVQENAGSQARSRSTVSRASSSDGSCSLGPEGPSPQSDPAICQPERLVPPSVSRACL